MDAPLEVVAGLRAAGFVADLNVSPDGLLVCGYCGTRHDASTLDVERVSRFEGASNPDDQLIMFAARTTCGHAGIYSSAYGCDASPADVTAIGRLSLGLRSSSHQTSPTESTSSR